MPHPLDRPAARHYRGRPARRARFHPGVERVGLIHVQSVMRITPRRSYSCLLTGRTMTSFGSVASPSKSSFTQNGAMYFRIGSSRPGPVQ